MRISLMYCKNDKINIINNSNHYFLENLKDKKITLGGINYELSSSIIGLKNYLIDLFNHFNNINNCENKINNRKDILLNRELLVHVMDNIYNYENKIIELFRKKLIIMKLKL